MAAVKVVTTSPAAQQFLSSIDEEELHLCMFTDDLVTISDDGNTTGEFSANVEKVIKGGDDLILVQASSHGKVDGTPMGTTITAYLRYNDLSLVKQEHFEYVKVVGHELEKRTEMTVDQDTGDLTLQRQVIMGDEIQKAEYSFPKEEIHGFVTEGTNVVLQRLMVRTGIHEDLAFVTIDSESGKLVQTVYKTLPERHQTVNDQELLVTGLERSVLSVADLPYTWQSFFMPDGHLTMRVQVGSPAIVTLEKVPRLIEREEVEEKPTFEKKSLNWEEDMELNSIFKQNKEKLAAGHDTYLRRHPEAQALLADFFKDVLLRKPDDVTQFAANYFGNFSVNHPPAPSYAHSKDEAPSTASSDQ